MYQDSGQEFYTTTGCTGCAKYQLCLHILQKMEMQKKHHAVNLSPSSSFHPFNSSQKNLSYPGTVEMELNRWVCWLRAPPSLTTATGRWRWGIMAQQQSRMASLHRSSHQMPACLDIGIEYSKDFTYSVLWGSVFHESLRLNIFSYASSSTPHPCQWVTRWVVVSE